MKTLFALELKKLTKKAAKGLSPALFAMIPKEKETAK